VPCVGMTTEISTLIEPSAGANTVDADGSRHLWPAELGDVGVDGWLMVRSCRTRTLGSLRRIQARSVNRDFFPTEEDYLSMQYGSTTCVDAGLPGSRFCTCGLMTWLGLSLDRTTLSS
jgi:hypothetical protein